MANGSRQSKSICLGQAPASSSHRTENTCSLAADGSRPLSSTNSGAESKGQHDEQDINATGTELIAKVSPDAKFLFFQRKIDGNTDIYWVDAKVIAQAKAVTRP
jgi:hypothetical protein